MHKEHYIDGKWIDCKSAIPFEDIKSIEKQQKEAKINLNIETDSDIAAHSPQKLYKVQIKDY